MSHSLLQADLWTKVALIAEIFKGMVNNILLFAPTLDNAFDWQSETPIGVSLKGLAASGSLAIAITAGTAYCSYLINLAHQQAEILDQDLIAQVAPSQTLAEPLLSHSHSLTTLQKGALLTNYIGHAAECAGPANYLISAFTAGRLHQLGEIAVNITLTGLGFLGTFATARTFKQTVCNYNQAHALASHQLNPLTVDLQIAP